MKKVLYLLTAVLSLAALNSCSELSLDQRNNETLSQTDSRTALNSTAPVILETAGIKMYYNGSGTRVLKLTGVANLKNLGYQKALTLRVSANGFGTPDSEKTWSDVPGKYRGSDANGYEQWTFESAEIPSVDYLNTDFFFALKYQVNGQTYWDNNAGKNYRLRWVQGYNMTHYDGPHGMINNGPVVLNTIRGTYTGTNTADVSVSVFVKNLGYTKKVALVYTTDGWKTTKTANAAYNSYIPFEVEGLNLECWNIALSGIPVTKMQFALSYQVNGITYWDNNLGKNYTWDLSNGALY